MGSDLPPTERAAPETAGLDELETPALLSLLIADQRAAVDAVMTQLPALAHVVDVVAARLRRGGRLHYVGAGTSGRLATLDAAEMPPTFGTPGETVCAHIAGGTAALTHAVEGAEDDRAAGEEAMTNHVTSHDAVVGISAGGAAAFVVGAIECARALGAFTAALTSVEGSPLARAAETAVVMPTGAEALAGSTRLKAGTAQKIALNALSTAVMVRLGKIHDNLMVDVVATNEKLHARALRLVRLLAGVDEARARALLAQAGGRVKIAVVMQRHGLDAERARTMLAQHGDTLRPLL
ncbi:MAG: N-acetylmuramic acid 6-phosphate etherase [Candidatus Eremiobacteraeota bacterium]|nr:N-acetylmuramic acid 6-phosphate etherase [Candidatus Eremiobacteraeota bacterium]